MTRVVFNKARLNRFKRADFGLSAAMWWPKARFDTVVVALLLVIWVGAPVNHPDWNCLTTNSCSPGMMVSMSTHTSCLELKVHHHGNPY